MISKFGETNPHTAAIARTATNTVAQMDRTTSRTRGPWLAARQGHEGLPKAVSNKIDAGNADYRSSNGRKLVYSRPWHTPRVLRSGVRLSWISIVAAGDNVDEGGRFADLRQLFSDGI